MDAKLSQCLYQLLAGYCTMRLDNIEQDGTGDILAVDPLLVTQRNLLAVCFPALVTGLLLIKPSMTSVGGIGLLIDVSSNGLREFSPKLVWR
ncbi:hypothetical protein ACB092_09G049300 [Castanea dentata]